MVKRKLNIPKHKLKDLEGFEDVLDLVGIDKSEVNKRDTRPIQSFAIFDFLERETERLHVIDQLFNNKINTIGEHRGHDSLIEKQKKNRNDLQKELTKVLEDKDSPLHKFLGDHFNKFLDRQ